MPFGNLVDAGQVLHGLLHRVNGEVGVFPVNAHNYHAKIDKIVTL